MAGTVKDALNRANPNDLPDLIRQIGFGDLLAAIAQSPITETPLTAVADVVTPVNKPSLVQSVEVLSVGGGGGALGAYVVDPQGTTGAISASHCRVDYAAGTITFLAADKVATATVVLNATAPASLATTLASAWPKV